MRLSISILAVLLLLAGAGSTVFGLSFASGERGLVLTLCGAIGLTGGCIVLAIALAVRRLEAVLLKPAAQAGFTAAPEAAETWSAPQASAAPPEFLRRAATEKTGKQPTLKPDRLSTGGDPLVMSMLEETAPHSLPPPLAAAPTAAKKPAAEATLSLQAAPALPPVTSAAPAAPVPPSTVAPDADFADSPRFPNFNAFDPAEEVEWTAFPAKPAPLVKPAPPAKPAPLVKPAELAKAAEPAKPEQHAKPAEPAEPAAPANSAAPAPLAAAAAAPPSAAPPAPAFEPPPHAPTPAEVGRYNAGGATYVMFSDGSIEAETDTGAYRFASMAELRDFIEHRGLPAGQPGQPA